MEAPVAKKKRAVRQDEKRRAEFAASQQRLGRRRNFVGLLGVFPLAASLGCGNVPLLDVLCTIPREWWLLIWAGLLGSFIGLTIRLVLERRRFQREAASRPSA
jgi:hypothetical protein